MQNKARAFAPSGISSFFEICDTTKTGRPIQDVDKVGARGGGFVTDKGVLTEVNVSPSKSNSITVFINGTFAPHAETTMSVAETLLKRSSKKFDVTIKHKVAVPVGAGFGTSAGGLQPRCLREQNSPLGPHGHDSGGKHSSAPERAGPSRNGLQRGDG